MTMKKDAYGNMIGTVARTVEHLTDREAASSVGLSTQKFNKVARKNEIVPTIVTGTEKNKYPMYVFTPEQVARVAALAAR
jgi:hypothetical protein